MSWQGYHWFHWVSLQGGRVVVVVVVAVNVLVVVAGVVDVVLVVSVGVVAGASVVAGDGIVVWAATSNAPTSTSSAMRRAGIAGTGDLRESGSIMRKRQSEVVAHELIDGLQ